MKRFFVDGSYQYYYIDIFVSVNYFIAVITLARQDNNKKR